MESILKVSVLIPTYNRHELLVETINGLLKQTYKNTEIVIYDQTSKHPPDTENFLKRISKEVNLIKGEPIGLVNAYRSCVKHAKGDICLFVDDDVLIQNENFIMQHVLNYSDQKIGAVAGQILHENQLKPAEFNWKAGSRYAWRHVRFDIAEVVGNMPSLAGGNMSFRRNIYDSIGGFDLLYSGNGFRFETDFSFAIIKSGYRIVFDPKASLIHRYGSDGGANNVCLGSLNSGSHKWYENFFSNTWYFLLKWYCLPEATFLMLEIWRKHAFNRSMIKTGFSFLINRHIVMFKGLNIGWKLWKRWKKESKKC